jgi:hypothetical protein
MDQRKASEKIRQKFKKMRRPRRRELRNIENDVLEVKMRR